MKYFNNDNGILYNGNCLDIMQSIDDKSIDCIICDLPYGTTACKWDVIIPFEPLWEQYKRIIKNKGAIVLFGNQPFTSMLVNSNLKWFRYEMIWNKKRPSNFQLMNFQPGRIHENIIVFSDSAAVYCKEKHMNYYPIKTNLDQSITKKKTMYGNNGATIRAGNSLKELGEREIVGLLPKSIIEFTNAKTKGRLHPTQKPLSLIEYLVQTYSKENDLILDNCSGSGTTALACENTNRKWICIEQEKEYCDITVNRLNENRNLMSFKDN